MEKMTPRERVLAVAQRKTPDRVPHFEWGFDAPIIRTLTRGGTYEDLIELLGIDAVMAGADYRRRPLGDDLALDEWGITQARGLMGHTIPLDEHAPIKGWKDFEQWSPPDPRAPYRLESLERLIGRFKGDRAIFVYVRDVWSVPRDLMGYMDLMIGCIEKPELVAAIVEQSVDHSIRIAEQAADMGADLVFTGDDIADNQRTLISPKTWEDLFAPHFRRLVEAFHGLGLLHWKHSDGNIMAVIDSLVDAGIDGIDPIDPLGGMDLATIKQKYGNRVALKGNVSCVTTLVDGSKEDVVEEVKSCIRIAGPGGGYVCSSSNSIHAGVKPELYRAMVEAIRTYGDYPLDMDRLAPCRAVDTL